MLKRVAVLIVGIIGATFAGAAAPNLYPNEIAGLKFYAGYLAPLRPMDSDVKAVVQVLGSDQGRDMKDWRIRALFSCTGDCPPGSQHGPLASIVIAPKRRVSFKRIKLPAIFSHEYGSVSEINVSCDIYSDNFGLAYWVVSGNSRSYKKGDLLWIEYGPARAAGRTGSRTESR
jgi:hypothetical protein